MCPSDLAKRDAATLALSIMMHRRCVWHATLDEVVEAYEVADVRTAHALAEAVWSACEVVRFGCHGLLPLPPKK